MTSWACGENLCRACCRHCSFQLIKLRTGVSYTCCSLCCHSQVNVPKQPFIVFRVHLIFRSCSGHFVFPASSLICLYISACTCTVFVVKYAPYHSYVCHIISFIVMVSCYFAVVGTIWAGSILPGSMSFCV